MPTSRPPAPGRLATLQAVRALAAAMVVVVHLAGPTAFEHKVFGRSLLDPLWHPAMTGVDLFFVVSGFVMVVTAGGALTGAAPRQSLGRFAWRRASRIYPLYWLVSLALLAVVLAAPQLVHGNGEPTSLPASFLLLPQAGEPLLLVGWTLVHEVGFYLVFALALAVRARWAAWGVLGAWAAVVLVGHLLVPHPSSPWLVVGFNPMNLEFLLGIGAGCLVLHARRGGAALLGAGAAILVLAWADLGAQGPLLRDPLVGALVVGTGAALAVAGLALLERDGRLRVPAALARLGDSSYSLYLVHVPAITLAAIVLARLLPPVGGGAGVAVQLLVVAAVAAGCALAASLTHRFAEQPLLRLTRSLERGRRDRRDVPAGTAEGVPGAPAPASPAPELSGQASTLTA